LINVSAEFKELMQERTDFRNYAEITFADGTMLPVSDEDFEIDGNTLVDGAGAKSLPLGAAICRTIQISLKNEDDHLSGYDFFGARIRLYLTFELSATTERIELGTFTVIDPESYGETVTVTASDDMYKADKPYETGLTFPVALSAMFQDSCTRCGIPYTTTAFKNAGFLVENLPAGDYTFREMFGFMAMIAGGNARISRLGYMEILTYDFWPEAAAHRLVDWSELTVATDDIFITGVQTIRTITDEDGNETEDPVLHGTEGYVLDLENPLFEGKEAEALALIGGAVVGASFRKFDGEYIGYPIAEFMDTVTITDRKGNVYSSVITDIEFEFGGFTSISNSAESAVRNSSKYISPATKILVAARKMVQTEKTAREAAVDHLNKMLAESSGLYTTEEEQEDGSVIYYLHDKPTIAESQNVMKLTSEAIGLSQDGGKTYPFGFTVTGEMVMSIIRAEGIEADWVRFGSKTVTEAINDTVQKVDDASQAVMTEVTDMLVERQAIIMAAMSSYMQTSNFETFKAELEAQLAVMADQVAITVSRETESLRQANADLQEKYEKIVINYRFTEDGLQIGSNENVLTICVANDRVSFQDNGAEVAYITGRQLYITDAHILHSLRVGGIAFVPRRNGNTSIVKAV